MYYEITKRLYFRVHPASRKWLPSGNIESSTTRFFRLRISCRRWMWSYQVENEWIYYCVLLSHSVALHALLASWSCWGPRRRESLNNMHASGTVRHDHDRDKDDITWRTSTQHFMSTDDAIMKSINIRVANLTKTNVKLQESAQVHNYCHSLVVHFI